MKKGKNEGNKKEINILITVLVLGDRNTGKSSFIKAYLDGYFSNYGDVRINQPSFKTLDSPEGKILFTILEYDGTVKPMNEMSILPSFDHFPSYREVFLTYKRKFDYIILLYDSTERGTFEELNEYLELIKKNERQDPLKIYLLGTKSDKFENRKVSEEEGKKFAEERNMNFKPITCLGEDGINNIKEIFNDIAKHYITTDSFKKQKQKIDEEAKKEEESRKKQCNIQ